MSPSLPPGARLGRYEINTLLGAGGMGEVYLADTEMDRTVAIKILLPALGLGPTAIVALHPESESTWALNHPPSLAIHETGATGVSRLIATEFIDRDTPRQRLSARFKLVDSVRIRFASVRLVNFR